MQKGLVSGLAAEILIEVWDPEKEWDEKVPHVTVAVLWKAYTDTDALGCDVRTKVEAPLDIKDVIYLASRRQ